MMNKATRWWAVLAVGFAAVAGAQQESATNQTTITSKTLDFDYGRMIAVFKDDVVVVDPQLRMECDQLTVLFERTNDIKSITAVGNVRVRQQDKTATAKKGIYLAREGKVILLGDATLIRGADTVKGDEITFWINENRMICRPGFLSITPSNRGGAGPESGFPGLERKKKPPSGGGSTSRPEARD
jgi:lipopolysaccharide transport protein LptA